VEDVGSGVDEVVGSGVELVLVLDVVMGATDDLEEVGAAVLLAWLLDPPPAVPDGDLSRAIYP